MKSFLRFLLLGAAAWAATGGLYAAEAPVVLAWQDNSNDEDGFKLERATGTGAFLPIATVAASITRYDDFTAAPSTAYRYRGRAFKGSQNSAYTNIASIVTAPTSATPAAPSGMEARTPGRLVNISARSAVVTGDKILIGGFVVAGDLPVQVLIRGVGPALSAFGISDALADPHLQLIGGPANDNWGDPATDAAVIAAAAQVFAFALPAGSKDAALLVTLPPGSYTVHLSGVGGATGVALLEIYEVPPPPPLSALEAPPLVPATEQ